MEPGTQRVQAEAPTAVATVPVAHATHVGGEVEEYVPTAHRGHDVCTFKKYVPGAQAVQTLPLAALE